RAASVAAGSHGRSEFDRQTDHEDIRTGEAEILMLEIPHGAAEQRGAAHEKEREGDLRGDEEAARGSRRPASAVRALPFGERGEKVEAGGREGGGEAEEQGGEQRGGGGEAEDAPVRVDG